MAGPRQRARRNTPLGVETAVCQEWQRSSLIPTLSRQDFYEDGINRVDCGTSMLRKQGVFLSSWPCLAALCCVPRSALVDLLRGAPDGRTW